MNGFKVSLPNIRISPRKARLVVDLIREKHVQDALDILAFTNKKAAPIIRKMIDSGIANATSTGGADVDNLVVGEAYVDCGSTFKRFMPRAQGRAFPIKRRTCHITVVLTEF